MSDEAISQLSVYSAYHSADEIEVLDTTDTTFASSGTNKRVTFASLISLVGLVTTGSSPSFGGLTIGSLSGIFYGNAGAVGTVTIGTGLSFSAGTLSATGAGSVTSVGLSMPSGFSVANSPVTSTGTLTVTTTLSGILKGTGTGFTTAAAGTDYAPATSGSSILAGNGSGGFSSVTIGTGLSFSAGTLSATAGGGTVTSVGLTVPSWLVVTGSPVTTAGTLAIGASTGTGANLVLASPNGASGAVSMRALVSADLPISGDASLVTATDGVTVTFDLSQGRYQQVTLGGNRTLAVSNVTTGQWFWTQLNQDATGSRTVTFFSGIRWADGVVPTLTTTPSKSDLFLFKCIGSGQYLGFTAGLNL